MRFCFLLPFILFCTTYNPIYGQSNIADRIDELITKQLPSSSEVGISVYNLSTQQEIYNHNGNKLSRPASTLKLITAVTALDREIPPFETSLWYNGVIENNVLYGDIYVVGGFDPEFDESRMDRLVSKINQLPIQKIHGNIYGDVSLKDSLYWGHGWAWDDNPNSYQPYLSPLMYNKGKVTVVAQPTQAGSPAIVSVTPKSSYYSVINTTASNSPSEDKFKVTRDWMNNQNTILVYGNVDRYRKVSLNMHNSSLFFIHTFYEKIINSGIQIEGGYDLKSIELGKETEELDRIKTPIYNVLKEMLKESDNLNAEATLHQLGRLSKDKHIGAEDGIAYIDTLIQKLGHLPGMYRVVDGSGLSAYNAISPDLLVSFLKYSYTNKAIYNVLEKTLPISGIDGTLAYRMKNSQAYKKIKAKTGTITFISGLAGYATNNKGQLLAFAILNQNILKGSQARRFQDAVCQILCE